MNIYYVKLVIKIILSASFIFDKTGNYNNITRIICAVVSLFVVIKRIYHAQYAFKSVQIAHSFYEIFVSLLLITVPIHQYLNEPFFKDTILSITSLLTQFFLSIFLSLFFYFLSNRNT